MYIYNGKLNFGTYAENDTITIVFPAGFSLNDPVCAYWQWTRDATGAEKGNTHHYGIVNSVTKTDKYHLTLTLEYYHFDAVVTSDFRTLTATMRNPSGNSSDTMKLSLQHGDTARVPSTSVFTGKFDWLTYAENEMITLVIPEDVSNGSPVGLYHQWTVDADGKEKTNHSVNTTFYNVTHSPNGRITGTFSDGYYKWEVAILSEDEATLHMSNPTGGTSTSNLKRTDFRKMGTKKALIFRFNTGTDDGIYLIREMLTKHLGFDIGDIEMCYFDIESPGGPMQCTKGQAPPTATNFRDKFTSFISSAKPGDVRFLYVDVHGEPRNDPGAGENDMDDGWIFAENNDGTKKEVVWDNWLGTAIRENHKAGVNLTILASSCIGSGMLDRHSKTEGVLLTGCHETQFNVKALRTDSHGRVDPWMYAVVSVMQSRVKRKRAVPDYTSLLDEAKKLVRDQLQGGELTAQYKGPSPDETEPIPRDPPTNTSNQDPQLVYCKGYIEPDTERFLFPFVAPDGGIATGDATRFPRDQF